MKHLVAALVLMLCAQARAGTIRIGDPFDPTFSVCATNFVRDCEYSYGVVDTGTTKRFSFTIENTDATALNVTALTVDGSPSFSLVGDPPTSVAASSTATVFVDFSPLQPGDPAAFVTISSDATNLNAGEDVVITLIGSGEDLVPGIEVTPAFCDFGAVGVGATAGCDLSIANTGDAELEIDNIEFTVDTPTVFTPSGVVVIPTFVQAGTTFTLSLTVTPDVATPQAGALLLTSNATTSPVRVGLCVNGGSCDAAEGEGEGEGEAGEGEAGEGEGESGEGEGEAGEGEGDAGDAGEGEGEGDAHAAAGCTTSSHATGLGLFALGLLLVRRRRA